MYVLDQPRFLNAVALLRTELAPLELLRRLKEIEVALGRQSGGMRNGPRPIDLDILFFSEGGGGGGEAGSWLDAGRGASWLTGQWDGSGTGDPDTDGIAAWNLPLELPHPRIHERQFVLKPLFDVAPDLVHPVSRLTVRAMLDQIGVGAPAEGEGWGLGGGIQGSAAEAEGAAVRVMPLREDRFFPLDRSHAMAAERQGRTFVMGILNVTPDRLVLVLLPLSSQNGCRAASDCHPFLPTPTPVAPAPVWSLCTHRFPLPPADHARPQLRPVWEI